MLLRIINRTEVAIICILLISMTLLVLVDVVMRFGFNHALEWSQEIPLYMSAWVLLFGASYGLKKGAHAAMESFVKYFPSANRRLLTAMVAVLAFIYCSIFFYGSWIYLKMMKMIGIHPELMALPSWVAHGFLLSGYLFLLFRLLMLLLAVVARNTEGFKHDITIKDSMVSTEDIFNGEGKS